jgi:ribosomal subunit interface protein
MEVSVKGRNSEISDRFRAQVDEKIERVKKFDSRQRILRVEVLVSHEKNPRDPATAARVEITVVSRGPVIRAEAVASDQYTALDVAMDKLVAQLRKIVARKRSHKSHPAPLATMPLADVVEPGTDDDVFGLHKVGPLDVEGDGPLVVREKTHESEPMTLDQALHAMELVGHDFYLFVEKDSMLPSVVYRRRGYDYGVIHLQVWQ